MDYSDKKFYGYGSDGHHVIKIDLSIYEAIIRAERQRKLIARVDKKRIKDYSKFKCENYFKIYPTADKNGE